MKKSKLGFVLIGIGVFTSTPGIVAKSNVDVEVKDLNRRIEQVDAQLDRSTHYLKKESSGDETTIEQAWFNGAGDLIKVSTEHTAAGSRELSEYFQTKFAAYEPMFILSRKETTQPDGSIQIEEARQYFDGNAELIRDLRKSARFKAGESTDTVRVPNKPVDLSKKRKDTRNEVEQAKARNEFFDKPIKIAGLLQQAGPPVSDPFANVTGDSGKYRVIEDSVSPDGRYAIALGLSEEKIDWESYRDKEMEGEGAPEIYTAEVDGLRNYVVDLTQRKILGITGVNYFGTKRRYNHRECIVAWSPDSKNFVETYSDKWNYETCRAGRIADGPKLVGTVDLGKYGEKAMQNFRKAHKQGDEEASIAIFASDVTNDGVISLEVVDQVSGGERKGDINFAADEKIRLREKSGALQLETVDVRKAPKDE